MPASQVPSFSKPSLFAKLLSFGTRALRTLPAEAAHDLAVSFLQQDALVKLVAPAMDQFGAQYATTVNGIGSLKHPIGLAAGFDKQARVTHAMQALGFSFVEVGTITPQPQPGNPKPRMFREPENLALVNRMGFNSDGAAVVAARVRSNAASHRSRLTIPIGINLGKNKQTPALQAADDYLKGYEIFKGLGSYYVFNLSSPNTPGLRELANPEFVEELGRGLGSELPKVWIKLDPDLPQPQFQKLIAAIAKMGYQGIILTNTHRVEAPEAGGLSGLPLAALSNTRLEWAHEVHQGKLAMIASGGIFSGQDVYERLARGACAVQIYTAMIYRGPWIVPMLLDELRAAMAVKGVGHISEMVGSFYIDK
jgi:dihydroorotate dehydrogenase